METIEQLKQENEKLNARLAKAVEVFKEQKANIETVTKERDELKSQYDDIFNASIKLGEEIAELKTKLHKQENIVDQDATIKGLREELEEYREKNKELKNELNNKEKQLNEYELKLQNSEAVYEELHKKYETRKEQQAELLGQIDELKSQIEQRTQQVRATENTASAEIKKITDARDELIIKCSDLESQLKAARDEITSLHSQLIKSESDADILRKSDKEYREAYEQQKKENKETEEQFNKVLDTYEKDLKEAKDEYCKLNSLFDSTQNECNRLENELKEAKEKLDIVSKQYDSKDQALKILQKIYDNLENEKLAITADYDTLEQKYKDLQSQQEVDSEFETHLTDTIFNIWNICDDIINQKPSEEELKEKLQNGKVIEIPKVKNSPNPKKLTNSTGNQFMSDANGMNI